MSYMRTPFDEGATAGYVGIDRAENPYRKGAAPLAPEVAMLALDWDRSHAKGQADARAGLLDKRRESCR
jgi:hypothetical protein